MSNYILSLPGSKVDETLLSAQNGISSLPNQGLSDTQKQNARENIGAVNSNDIGVINNLTTVSKANLVSAINELNSKISGALKVNVKVEAVDGGTKITTTDKDGIEKTAYVWDGESGSQGYAGKSISSVELTNDYKLKFIFSDGTTQTINSSVRGANGVGITSITPSENTTSSYKLDIRYGDGSSFVTDNLRASNDIASAEIVDARVDTNGNEWSSLGKAIRGQVNGLKGYLTKAGIFYPATWTVGKIWNYTAQGFVKNDSSDFSCTQIDISDKPAKLYIKVYNKSNNNLMIWAGYNGKVAKAYSFTEKEVEETLIIPDYVDYLYLSTLTDYTSKSIICQASAENIYLEDKVANIEKNMAIIFNSIKCKIDGSETWTDGSKFNSSGSVVSDANYSISSSIEIPPRVKLKISTSGNIGDTLYYPIYTSTGIIIKVEKHTFMHTGYESFVITVPDDGAKIRLTNIKSDKTNVSVYTGT